MHNPTQRGRIIPMSKPIPTTEQERTEEARELVAMIPEEAYIQLTSWERETIEEIKEGKASTKFRLTEIRQIVKRLQSDAS
jgi:ribosome recycling factor